MVGKLLIIGDKTISNALVNVLNIFDSYQFLDINYSDFSDLGLLVNDLEKFKDNQEIKVIITTDPDGVELTKHIRLSNNLGNLSLLPIIAVSSETVEQCVKKQQDNIFLLSPNCHHIPVSSLQKRDCQHLSPMV